MNPSLTKRIEEGAQFVGGLLSEQMRDDVLKRMTNPSLKDLSIHDDQTLAKEWVVLHLYLFWYGFKTCGHDVSQREAVQYFLDCHSTHVLRSLIETKVLSPHEDWSQFLNDRFEEYDSLTTSEKLGLYKVANAFFHRFQFHDLNVLTATTVGFTYQVIANVELARSLCKEWQELRATLEN